MIELTRALRIKRNSKMVVIELGGESGVIDQIMGEISWDGLVVSDHHLAERSSVSYSQYTITDINHIPHDTPDSPGKVLFNLPERGVGEKKETFRNLFENLQPLMVQFQGLGLIDLDWSIKSLVDEEFSIGPNFPGWISQVVVVVDINGIRKPRSAGFVHVPEIATDIENIIAGCVFSAEDLLRVLRFMTAAIKNNFPLVEVICLINRCDTSSKVIHANQIGENLLKVIDRILIADIKPTYQKTSLCSKVLEKSAAIVLAAGESSRLGIPKQTLIYKGVPLVRRAVETGLSAGLDPVIVVTGCYQDAVEAALSGFPARMVYNPDWKFGQGTSISVGVAEMPGCVGSCVFLLCDQPFVSSELIRAIVDFHATSLYPIVIPYVRGTRSNPALFDQDTFGDLRLLNGDIGGRALFPKYQIMGYPWMDDRILMDIDTIADLETLNRMDE